MKAGNIIGALCFAVFAVGALAASRVGLKERNQAEAENLSAPATAPDRIVEEVMGYYDGWGNTVACMHRSLIEQRPPVDVILGDDSCPKRTHPYYMRKLKMHNMEATAWRRRSSVVVNNVLYQVFEIEYRRTP